jgi:hypothetical protein
MQEKPKKIIGRADQIDLPEQELFDVPAKVDTGAKTSALWASNVTVDWRLHSLGRQAHFIRVRNAL